MKKLLLSLALASSLATSALAELHVVASFSVIENIAYEIGKDKIKLTTLVKRDQDPHGYEPSLTDIQNLYNTDLLIINGLNFEHWLTRALKQSNFTGTTVVASNGINVIHLDDDHDHDHEDDEHHDHGHDHGDVDPHVWQNPLNGIIMAQNITQAFIEKDPENQKFYEKNLADLSARLRELDQKIMNKLQNNPSQPLKGIVLHDSFRYFSERYPMQFFPILGAHSISEPSVKTFAGVQNLIQTNQIPVIFSESMEQTRFATTVANDYNIVNGGQLISDTVLRLGKMCDSYIGILECNLETIDQAFHTVRSNQ